MLGLYAAVTRQTTSGKPDAGWFPDERIGIRDAILAYTYNTAYANCEEKIKGSIEVGKFADLTVLSKNLLKVTPKELLTTDVVTQWLMGRLFIETSEGRHARLSAICASARPVLSGATASPI